MLEPGNRLIPRINPEWCSQVLPRVSRTFALSIEALPEVLREPVRTAYLLCRIVDTVEDQAELSPAERDTLFDAFDAALSDGDGRDFQDLACKFGLNADGADGELCQRAGVVFDRFRGLPEGQREAIRPHVAEMSQGMRQFAHRAEEAGRLRLEDIEDLERYCYYVAGTVGQLLTALFELAVPGVPADALAEIRSRAVSFGLGLQMVNILKDVVADHERGDCFLPASVARDQGIELEQLLEPEARSAALRVVRRVSEIARSHLLRAREYSSLWPPQTGRSVRMFCAVPLALALATLYEIDEGSSTLVVGAEPKISRQAVAQIFTLAAASLHDNTALSNLLDRCERGDFR